MVENGAFSKKEFADWGKGHVLFCHITSQIDGEKYGNLLSEKGGQGFPYFVFMDANGQILARHQTGEREIENFDKTAMEAVANRTKLADLAQKGAAGDEKAKVELFRMQLALGHLKFDEATKAFGELKLSDEEKKGMSGELASLEVGSILEKVNSDETQAKAAAEFRDMMKAGRIPAGKGEAQPFCLWILDLAKREKDLASFEQVIGVLRQQFGDIPQAAKFIDEQEKILKEMKEEGVPK